MTVRHGCYRPSWIRLRTLVTATLAADHRHSDGHLGALFLAQSGQRLREPKNL